MACEANEMAAFDISKLLTEVDKFCDGDQMEKLRLLAMAVVPYGMIEDTSTVLDIYRKIETRYHEGATPIFTRMMEKASFRRKYISQLSQQQACETEEIPLLYFTEILVEISDELGNAEYLRRLKNRIPEDNLGTSRDRITTAVQLFQKLIFARTISLDEDIKSLEHLSEWLDDIGRQDIAKKVKDEIKKSKYCLFFYINSCI